MSQRLIQRRSEVAIHLGAMLDAVNANERLRWVHPVENAPVADAKLAQAGQFIRHSNQTAVDDDRCIFRQPENFAFDARPNRGIKGGELRTRLGAYFAWKGMAGAAVARL